MLLSRQAGDIHAAQRYGNLPGTGDVRHRLSFLCARLTSQLMIQMGHMQGHQRIAFSGATELMEHMQQAQRVSASRHSYNHNTLRWQ
ncbi:hypothetical protein KSZ_45610 [Dictyobacter formicarum]|uniref:Uncharacterized protein n=1 Tax=Dictyobacter formicarum TaxID=2778368 RepID=A0ABQ3VK11_9CHLR|nr:hypothetical protein KSZ_45610 [Dictyobacter formicarum]